MIQTEVKLAEGQSILDVCRQEWEAEVAKNHQAAVEHLQKEREQAALSLSRVLGIPIDVELIKITDDRLFKAEIDGQLFACDRTKHEFFNWFVGKSCERCKALYPAGFNLRSRIDVGQNLAAPDPECVCLVCKNEARLRNTPPPSTESRLLEALSWFVEERMPQQ